MKETIKTGSRGRPPKKENIYGAASVIFAETRAKLHGSFLLFVQTFFPIVTGREFLISQPVGRESHFITVARELTAVSRGQQRDLLINLPPGYSKSTLVAMWVAWNFALYPDCQFLYISYSHELATKHTEFIKRLMSTHMYRDLFDIFIADDSRAKDSFKTNYGGSVKAFGSAGSIVGQDAGLPNLDRFSGAVLIDDAHKPDEVHSQTIREKVIQSYRETIIQRPRSPNVPIIYIGQRLHEADLCSYMLSGLDERKYKAVILKALDDAGNALYPEVNPREQLLEKKEKNPYVFASQFQQDPIPPGGSLYKQDDFALLDEDPIFISTFITCDTAETDKEYNDATVFSFWGLYKIEGSNTMALHCIDAIQLRIEPKDLEYEFRAFHNDCMIYKVKPTFVAIEKKSTGTTLLSVLQAARGLQLREVKRTRASGSKTQRFLEMQPLIAARLISFPRYGKHTPWCIEHMIKITANNSHRFDDFADNMYDACKIALIDKTIAPTTSDEHKERVLSTMRDSFDRRLRVSKPTWSVSNGRDTKGFG